MKTRLTTLLAPFFVIVLTNSSDAASAIWNGTADATWTNGSNWSATPSPGSGDTATFNNAGGAVDVIDLSASGVTIGNIIFDTATTAAYTIGSGAVGSQSLALNDSGTISANNTIAANQIFNAKLILGSDATAQSYSITNNSTVNTLTFAGGISGGLTGTAGAKALAVTTAPFGNGGVTLSGPITNGGADSLGLLVSPVSGSVQVNIGNASNTFSGGTVIASGVRLNVNGGGGKGLGTGLVTVGSGGQAYLNSAGVYSNNFAISGAYSDSLGAIRIGATGTNTLNGNITLNANSSIGVDSGRSAVINGNITGAFNFTKVSSGTPALTSPLTLAGVNDYTGTTTVTSGVISLARQSALYNSDAANWIPAKISVAANTGLALGVGDSASGFWDAAAISTFLGATQMGTSTTTAGFKSNSYIGFDTTNASGGTFTYNTPIANIGTSTNNGLVKVGTGTFVLAAVNSYTGGTSVLGGTLNLSAAGTLLTSPSVSINSGGTFSNTGGTAAFSNTVNPAGGTFSQSSGTTTTTTVTTSGSADLGFISITGGSFTASGAISLGRSFNSTTVPSIAAPLAASTSSGIYINGATASVSAGTLAIGTANSSSSVRVNAGSLSVTGAVTVGKTTSTSRWDVLQVSGGTFSAPDTANGVTLSPNNGTNINNAEFFLSGGVSTTGRISFGAATDTVGGNGLLVIDGGELYVGTGGIVKASTIGAYNYSIGVKSGTLGAAADWSSQLNITLGANPIIKAADSADAAHDITLGGTLSGSGFTKTGSGKLTLSGASNYSGNTTVSSGILELGSTGSLKFVPTTNGVSNKITGIGSVSLKGTFNIDLAGASAVAGNTWSLVDVGTLAATFDPSFNIPGFTESSDVWIKPDGGNLWTFKESTGELTYTSASAFAAWLDTPAFGLTSGQKGTNADPDSDGISNLVEFVLNGNPGASDPSILPQLVVTATDFEFTFSRRDDSLSPETTQIFQYGTDLFGWTDVIVPAASGMVGAATITVSNGIPADTVKVSIPKSTIAPETKLFGRLQVTK